MSKTLVSTQILFNLCTGALCNYSLHSESPPDRSQGRSPLWQLHVPERRVKRQWACWWREQSIHVWRWRQLSGKQTCTTHKTSLELELLPHWVTSGNSILGNSAFLQAYRHLPIHVSKQCLQVRSRFLTFSGLVYCRLTRMEREQRNLMASGNQPRIRRGALLPRKRKPRLSQKAGKVQQERRRLPRRKLLPKGWPPRSSSCFCTSSFAALVWSFLRKNCAKCQRRSCSKTAYAATFFLQHSEYHLREAEVVEICALFWPCGAC